MTADTVALERTTIPAVVDLNDIKDLAVMPVWSESGPSAAALLGVSRALAYRLAANGQIPVVRLGRRLGVSVPRLVAMLSENSTEAGKLSATELAAAQRLRNAGANTVPRSGDIHTLLAALDRLSAD